MFTSRKKLISTVLISTFILATVFSAVASAKTKVTYWQYYYKPRVKTMNTLIEEFEAENPNINVEQKTFPYNNYQQKIASMVPAGKGPDVVTLFYGWLPKWVLSGYIQPLPKERFSTEKIDKEFSPLVDVSKLGGRYWALPTAVRTLALFYNKNIFEKHGISGPPETLKELVEIAKKTTVKKDNGELKYEGFTWDWEGQAHSWYKSVLVQLFGGKYISDNNKKILIGDNEGPVEALKWYAGLSMKKNWGPNVAKRGYYENGPTAFMSGKAAMHIDGSFRISGVRQKAKETDLEFGIAPLPSRNGKERNFGSFWTHAITRGVKGDKLDAAAKFLKWITSEHAMELWVENVGELPAKTEVAKQYFDHPLYGPFLKQLDVSHAYFTVNEFENKKASQDMIDKITLKGVAPKKALDELDRRLQKLLDEFWKKYNKKF